MSIEELLDKNGCGCCELEIEPTPQEIYNRPGLATIRYRIGTFSSFRQAMIDAVRFAKVTIDGNTFYPLLDWTARASDDYAIALLEMWAYVADILTFYQERIANESFVRTALLRESVLKLAALLDYEPAPGVAATANLIFTLEKDRQVKIPVGLRVQSVPGQDEKPQKFETVESITAATRLNKVKVFPTPQPYNALAQNSASGALNPGNASAIAAALSKNDKLVVSLVGNGGVEEKQVEKLEVFASHTVLTWSSAILAASGGAKMFKWARKFRLFGHNAPSYYLEPSIDSDEKVVFTKQPVSFSKPSGTELFLDGIYEDLKEDTFVLIVVPGALLLYALIQEVTQAGRSVGRSGEVPLMAATVTRLKLNMTVPVISDIRSAVVYQLVGPEITFWSQIYPSALSGSVAFVPLSQLDSLESNRALLLDDEKAQPQKVTVTSATPVDTDGDMVNDHLAVSFTPALARDLKTDSAVLYGNVAVATHGETVAGEVLGNGDASAIFQSFQIRKSPVTFTQQQGAPYGAANTLQVRINGVLWHEARTLFGHDGDERIYTTTVSHENRMIVQFGNGINGFRVPTGRNNVIATYRQGLGRDGNVRANSLTTLLDRPVGLKSATNLVSAQGGAEPESLEQARTNAPNTVRTFGRVVSLRDFEDAAREFAGVAKARASLEWDGLEQVIYLTVAGDEGDAITGETKKNLVKDLNSRRDPNRKLVVKTYREVFIQVEVVIKVNSDFAGEQVQAAARAALLGYFAFDNLDFGQPIHLSSLYKVMQDVEGVVAVDIDRLQFKDSSVGVSHGATADAVQGHLRIFPAELARIEDASADAAVGLATG